MITLVLMFAAPVVVIVTGFVPEVLQLVPEVPVCPPEDRFRFCAERTLNKNNEAVRKVVQRKALKLTFRFDLHIRGWISDEGI